MKSPLQSSPISRTPLGRILSLATLVLLAIAAPQILPARDVVIPFNKGNFSDPLDIDNRYFPLVPGTIFTYRADSGNGCEEVRVEVTNRTRRVAGVRTRVVHDQAFEDPDCNGNLVLAEDTFDWHAQDNAGNVWYFGEDTRDCTPDGGCTPGEGSWEAGVNGAVAGIIMLANPRNGDEYQQEFAEGVAEDRGKVIGTDVWVSLYREDAFPPGDFHNCVKIQDSTPLDPGSIEHKFYCPGIGLVAIDEQHGSTVRSELVE